MIKDFNIIRRSVDARKTRGIRGSSFLSGISHIRLVYNVQVSLMDPQLELAVTKKPKIDAKIVEEMTPYTPTRKKNDSKLSSREPIIVGSGPAGLFAAYTLICAGFQPIVIEMGPKVERRTKDLMSFWKKNILTPNSNGVFGEGGAGAFSDGKLTTRSSSIYHRFVHETLIKYGANQSILYESRAHIGTDNLRKIITRFSDDMSRSGATFLYNCKVTKVNVQGGRVTGVEVEKMPLKTAEEEMEYSSCWKKVRERKGQGEGQEPDEPVPSTFTLKVSDLFVATGHSSREMFTNLHASKVKLSSKEFAIGLRLQISQKAINEMQYGANTHVRGDVDGAGREVGGGDANSDKESRILLGPAEFTLKHFDKTTGRNVYTFCMCPGGVIVNASHGNSEMAINGMSYSTRASRFANAAFVVNVTTEDFRDFRESMGMEVDPLSGLRFQQHWERRCFEAGGGDYFAPAQRLVDYVNVKKNSSERDTSLPDHIFMGKLRYSNLHDVLPEFVNEALINAMEKFSKNIPCLLDKDTLLVGVETRTSSPVRVDRDEDTLQSVNTLGLYPIGEGAGYAGGIMTACVDGVRAGEAMVCQLDGSQRQDSQYREDRSAGSSYPAW